MASYIKQLLPIAFLFLFSTAAFSQDSVGNAVYMTCWEQMDVHAGATECLYDNLKRYEEKLAQFEREALEKAVENDREFQPLHQYEIEFQKYQKDSNEAFKAYMESECARVRHSYMAGNGAADGFAICKIDLINERLIRF